MRVLDGEPGVECQIDFAQMGFILDPESGKKHRVHALIFTACYSRHMFVWLTYSQTLSAVIAGCEAAWEFFGGVFKVIIPDNLRPVVANADAVNPTLSAGWLDYAQHAGFVTDTARVRRPRDKPKVERAVQYVRGQLLRRRGLHGPERCSGQSGGVVPGHGRDAGPRDDRRPTGRGLHPGREALPSNGSRRL